MAAVSWLRITTNRLSAFRSVPSLFFFLFFFLPRSTHSFVNLLTAEFNFKIPAPSENQATTSIYVERGADAPIVNFAKKIKQKEEGVESVAFLCKLLQFYTNLKNV